MELELLALLPLLGQLDIRPALEVFRRRRAAERATRRGAPGALEQRLAGRFDAPISEEFRQGFQGRGGVSAQEFSGIETATRRRILETQLQDFRVALSNQVIASNNILDTGKQTLAEPGQTEEGRALAAQLLRQSRMNGIRNLQALQDQFQSVMQTPEGRELFAQMMNEFRFSSLQGIPQEQPTPLGFR